MLAFRFFYLYLCKTIFEKTKKLKKYGKIQRRNHH
jgi:hypothetical protein